MEAFRRPRKYVSITGRMGQTSIERLRDYLGQLPPQAQALLMREFERAIERGQDVAVANLVLEQLRKVVRSPEDDAPPPPAARTMCRWHPAAGISRGSCSGRSSRSWSTATRRPGPDRSVAPR